MPYLSTPRRPVPAARGRRRASRGRSPEVAGRPDRYQSQDQGQRHPAQLAR